MRRFLRSRLLSVPEFIAHANASPCQKLDSVIEDSLRMAAEEAGAFEPCECRKIARGDLNGDGHEDAAVVFTLEGLCGTEGEKPGTCGNQHEQYLQVFIATEDRLSPGPKLLVGGKLSGGVDDIRVQNGAIGASTVSHSATDPACCPSIHGRATFVLRGGKIERR